MDIDGATSVLNHVSAGCFYAYDGIRRTVVAHVFGRRTLATGRLLSYCRPLRSWYGPSGWLAALYESRLREGKAARYQQALHSAH
ncbi:IS1 family transposase [Escherichia coli]